MPGLSSIKKTAMQVADAITAALDIETEIVDDRLQIISGTGRYVRKIGAYEEDGDLDGGYIYASILKNGSEYICMDVRSDPGYNQKEGELAEISCPIQSGTDIIGIIGLVAFTDEQRDKMILKSDTFLNFLRRMSELIAGKLIESQSSTKLASMLESMPEGLLAADKDGRIFSCNFTCEMLLQKTRDMLVGTSIYDHFQKNAFFTAKENETGISNREVTYKYKNSSRRLFFSSVPLPGTGTMYLFEESSSAAAKARQFTYTNDPTTFEDICGESTLMKDVKQRAAQVACSDSTILISGESGTGKELFARAIHNASPRRSEAFIPINCGAIPDALLESELFGYEKGAFTGADKSGKIGKFELADSGTLFLDEVGDMPLHLQVKLLHVLQDRSLERVGGILPINIDVRIIAATNKNLEQMIFRGEFREDLFFRLNVIPIFIPPLRERREDTETLLHHALERFDSMLGKNIRGFDRKALRLFMDYRWPGNVRELENAVEYSVNMTEGSMISAGNIPPRIRDAAGRTFSAQNNSAADMTLKTQTEMAQMKIIENCLKKTGTSLRGKRNAASVLGISESTLYRKIRELGMKDPR